MAMDDKQIERRLDAMLALLAKLHDEVIAMKRGVAGENPLRDVMVHYDDLWRGLYARGTDVHYEFNRSIDPAHIKRLLKVLDVTTLKHRVVRYFNDREPFLVKNRHPFNLFISRMNSYTGGAKEPSTAPLSLAEPVPGCAHKPPCGTDHEHTKRRMEEMKHVE